LTLDKVIASLLFGPPCIKQVALTVSVLPDFEPPTLFAASLLSLGLIVMISSGGSHQFLYKESGNKTKTFSALSCYGMI